jgi:hypothetical protein
MTVYHFRDSGDFDNRCAPRDGGPTPTIVSSAYKVTNGGALLRDRYASSATGPSALAIFGQSGFYTESGGNNYDIAGRLAAINRNCVPTNVPPAVSLQLSGPAFASLAFMSDGRIQKNETGSITYPTRWGNSAVDGSDFQVRFTLLSGSVDGTFADWRSIGSAQSVSCSVGDGRSQGGEVKVEWRYGSSGYIFSDNFRVEASSGPL